MHARPISAGESLFELNKTVTQIKIGKIRKIVKQYKRKAFQLNNEYEIFQVDSFLKQYADKPKNYILSSRDLFKLLNIIKVRNELKLIRLLRNMFNSSYLFEMIAILDKFGLLDEKSFETLYSKLEDPFFLRILKELAKAELLDKDILYQWPKKEENFYKVLEYLNKINILNKNPLLLKKILEIFTEKDDDNLRKLLEAFASADFIINENNLNIILEEKDVSYITKIFIPLSASGLADNNNLNTLLSLSYANYDRVTHLILDLNKVKLLDEVSFKESINIVTAKLPPVLESKVVKNNRKDTGAPKSEFILDNKIHFFAQHKLNKDYPGGGFGLVKKTFNAHGKSKYAMKKLKKDNIDEAKREVSYNQLLGRKAYHFFRKGKRYIVSPWQFGKNLDDYSVSEIKLQPIENRLQWLISGLSQLNVLHQNYRLHGDIKPLNFILSIKKAALRLIDFGGARKRDTDESFAYTSDFLSKSPNTITSFKYDFCDDVYSMGMVVAFVFPELYSIKYKDKNAEDQRAEVLDIKPSGLTLQEKGIKNLVDSMMHQQGAMRCSVSDALKYCRALLAKKDVLDEDVVKEISDATINRSVVTVDDAIHGALKGGVIFSKWSL